MKKPAQRGGKPSLPSVKGKSTVPDFMEAQADESTLEKIREQMRLTRDTERRIADLKSVLAEEQNSLQRMKFEILPELFALAGVDNLGLPAEGNNPAFDFNLRKYYHASIGADWDDDRRDAAFKFLEQKAVGGSDLIKTEITVTIPREKRGLAKSVQAALRKLVPSDSMNVELSVPWNTLTAFVKEAIEDRGLILPMDKLGATHGMIVNMKERKSDGTTQKASRSPTGHGKAPGPEGTRR